MQESIIYKNTKISFSSDGKGSAIVLLHGFLESSEMWMDFISELSKRNRVICIDLLGHGKTDCLGYVHSMEEMADSVKAVLKHLKLRRVTLIGHSMGGYVALAFAEKYPKYVKKMALVNSTAQADDEKRKKNRLRAIKMAQTNYKSLVSMSMTNLFADENRNQFTKEIEHSKEVALQTSVQGYVACTEGMRIRKNREVVLASEGYKKLLIVGKKDPILDYNAVVEEAKRTNTSLIVFSGGHMSHIENKEELQKTLCDFIKS